MSIGKKLQTIAENEQKVYDAGKQAEHKEFWDSYITDSSTYPVYNYAFAGPNWVDSNFRPHHDLVPRFSYGDHMFCQSGICHLKSILEELGISLDFSHCTSFSQVFYRSQITELGEVSTLGATSLTALFNYATYLTTVDNLILKSDGSQTLGTGAFANANALTNITITGCIGSTVDFRYSPLSKASIESVIAALHTSKTGQKLTFNKLVVDTAFETSAGAADGSASAEWLALVASKPNWTITLV